MCKKKKFWSILILPVVLLFACKTKQSPSGLSGIKKSGPSAVSQVEIDSLTLLYPNEDLILISTKYGNMLARLFNETPQHRDNCIKLINKGFYDSLLFHRVINLFMIQGGDPDSRKAKPGQLLGDGDVGYWIPAEFNKNLFHKKGMLCAARESDDKNPEKASSGCQFYIVDGKKFDDKSLKNVEYRINRDLRNQLKEEFLNKPENQKINADEERFRIEQKRDSLRILDAKLDSLIKPLYESKPHYVFSDQQKEVYKTVGGTPHLDGSYTVYGEVIKGLEIIDKIASVATDDNDRPLDDIRMSVKIIKQYKH